MVKVLAATTLAAITISLLLSIHSFQNSSRIAELERSSEKGKITWYAAMAKAKDQTEIGIGATLVRYAVPRSFDEALASYSVVVVEPLSSKTQVTTYDIQTWYKFRIIERLSITTKICAGCSTGPEPPPDLLPLNDREFLASKPGGEAVVDDIKIVSKDVKFPDFQLNKRYLLFVAFDPTETLGILRMGPWGTFRITPDGKLKPVDEKLKHHVSDELTNRFGNSLDQLSKHLKSIDTKHN